MGEVKGGAAAHGAGGRRWRAGIVVAVLSVAWVFAGAGRPGSAAQLPVPSLPSLPTPRPTLPPAPTLPAVPTLPAAPTLPGLQVRTVWAWGDNQMGEFGDGTATYPSSTPRPSLLPPPRSMAAGFLHSVAALQDGTVVQWGWVARNSPLVEPCYVTGSGSSDSCYRAPHPVMWPAGSGVHRALAVAAGAKHDLALLEDHTVWAWSAGAGEVYQGYPNRNDSDYYGQLGDGAVGEGPAKGPVEVTAKDGSPLTHVVAVAAGADHSLALRDDGTVWGWGDNSYGGVGGQYPGDCRDISWVPQPGAGPTTLYDVCPRAVPVRLTGGSAILNVGTGGSALVTAGARGGAALASDGGVLWTWGDFAIAFGGGTSYGCRAAGCYAHPMPGQPGPLAMVAASSDHALAITRADGSVWAWGSNYSGQLGNAGGDSPVPVQVAGLTGVKFVATGWEDSFAIAADNTLLAWGDGQLGQLGDGQINPRQTSPVRVGLVGAGTVSAGPFHTLATSADITPPPPGRRPPVPCIPCLEPTLPGAPHLNPLPGGGPLGVPTVQSLVAPAAHPLPASSGPQLHPGGPGGTGGSATLSGGPPAPPPGHAPAAAGSGAAVNAAANPVVASAPGMHPAGVPGSLVAPANPVVNPALGAVQEEGGAGATEYAMVRRQSNPDLPGLALTLAAVGIAGCVVALHRRRRRVIPCWSEGTGGGRTADPEWRP